MFLGRGFAESAEEQGSKTVLVNRSAIGRELKAGLSDVTLLP